MIEDSNQPSDSGSVSNAFVVRSHPISVDVETIITDYDWCEDSRPILAISECKKSAVLKVGAGQHAPQVEWTGNSEEDLASQIAGMAEVFAAARMQLVGEYDADGENVTCGYCGTRMTVVRPGKHQCDNETCFANQ